ncbi:Panacea domain-containing protein [Serratia fonticola]|uniref:Panacea domain-containing protein n=1 Tax=Serratia fonticola TaxID=47917 RepID=A0ABY9PJ19_SERFO|nr:Panacea domain-containing protein [Serratia fonticola]WMT13371.1 Panacea domain-containing protein [Serratia fonticola]
MLNVWFDSEKALEAILYVASRAPVPDIYHVGKILYFADRVHLDRYGRLITGDKYRAMKDGPVAHHMYDIIKIARGDGVVVPKGCSKDDIKRSLSVKGLRVKSLREADEDLFSDSDIECIDQAIKEYGRKSFKAIRDISHDDVWSSVDLNEDIPLETIAKSCEDGDKLVAYLSTGI